jgi:hypothetical protein
MKTLLSSESFTRAEDAVDFIEYNYYYENVDIIEVALYTKEKGKRHTYAGELKKILTSKTIYKREPYYFDFKNKVYKEGSKVLHFTDGEQVFLYKWLVLGNAQKNYFLKNIHSRYGYDFLSEEE